MRDKVKSYMKTLINEKSTGVDKEYHELQKRYREMFGEPVPTEMLPSRITDEQIKQAMRECIDTGKNNLLDILGVIIDYKVLY